MFLQRRFLLGGGRKHISDFIQLSQFYRLPSTLRNQLFDFSLRGGQIPFHAHLLDTPLSVRVRYTRIVFITKYY